MRQLLRCIALTWLVLVFPAMTAAAGGITREAIENARFEKPPAKGRSAMVVKLQVLLDRVHLSPGSIDGTWGDNVRKAVHLFRLTEDLPEEGDLDEALWARLVEVAGDKPITVEYQLSDDDVNQTFVDKIPEDYGEKAKLKCQCFTSMVEYLGEKFHMHPELVRALNPKADWTRAGETVVVVDVGAPAKTPVARIEVDKPRGVVRAYDKEDRLVAAYPATIGSEDTPSPTGTHKVVTVAKNPHYYYRPDVNFKQGDNDKPLKISPGPNSPVGTMWIDLSKPTYGIHGTPEPEQIDKVGSHGCVRLTNWDVEELAGLVKKGVEVVFQD